MDKFVVRSPKNSPTSSPRKSGIKNFRQSTLLSLKGVVIIEDLERAKIVLERNDTKVELKIDTLRHLKMKKPAKEILVKTGIGKTVYKLTKSEDKALASEAKTVHKMWKEHIEKILGRPMLEVKCDLKTQNFRKSARQMILDGLKRDYSVEGGKLLNEMSDNKKRHVEENVGQKKSDDSRKDTGSKSEVDPTTKTTRKEQEKDERKHEKDSKHKSKKKKSKSREREEDSKTGHTSKAVSGETVEIDETEKVTKIHERDLTEESKKDKRSRKECDSIDIPVENDKKRRKEKDKETKKEDSEHVSKRKKSDYKEHKHSKREKDSKADAENVDKGERKDKRKSEKHHRHKSERRSEDSKKDKCYKDNSMEVLSENIERDNCKRKSEDAKHESKKRKSETREKEDKSDIDCNSIEVLAEYIEREVYQNTKRMINKSYKRTIRKLVFCLRHQSDMRKAVASSSLSVKDFVKENLQE